MSERRIDPSDGNSYTFEEISRFYARQYRKKEIERYWETMTRVDAELPALDEVSGALAIDGSYGEGGGQVLRNTFAYAAVLGIPIRVDKIRNGRPKPGLAAQHLTGITAVSNLSGGSLTGASKGSQEVLFVPAKEGVENKIKVLVADCGTAGALTLVAQSILPVLVLGNRGREQPRTVVNCRGGTDVPFSPPIDYFLNVTLPNLARFGVQAHIEVETRGLMPAGGGVVNISCTPVEQLLPVQLVDFGKLVSVKVRALFCGKDITQKTAELTSAAAASLIRDALPGEVNIDQTVALVAPLSVPASNFLSVSITAQTSTGCFLNGNAMEATRSPSPGQLAAKACDSVLADIRIGACLDTHCSDQVVIFMALASGQSAFRMGPLSEHTRTAMHFATVCTGAQFQVTAVPDADKRLCEVRCNGIGERIRASRSGPST